MKNIFHKPLRNYTILALVIIFLILDFFVPGSRWMLLVVSIAGAIPTVVGAAISAFRLHINIDVFNIFALGVAFATGEIQAAAFIVLMLNSAELLDFYTESKAKNAVEKLLALKPRKAIVEKGGNLREIAVEEIKLNDVVVVKAGSFIPVDGIIIFGTSFVNEGSVTGESTPVEKIVGDNVLSSTLNGSGVLKIKAVGVGKESTIERMAALIREAAKNKSRPEKLADRFAAIFLPIVIIIGVIVYLVTKNITMTAAIFLVACADDMAVAVPLATVASIGRAAKRGVIIKGGAWLNALAKVKTLVLDKTGTLTYGQFALQDVLIEPGTAKEDFWLRVGVAEKYSEHPVGHAIFKEAVKYTNGIPDPDKLEIVKGRGVRARYHEEEITIGNEVFFKELNIAIPEHAKGRVGGVGFSAMPSWVAFGTTYAGAIMIADVPKEEAKESIEAIQKLGINRIVMLTGDKDTVAKSIADALGIKEFRASMNPEDKLREIEMLANTGVVAMVGDGINDAPSLSRADVGIAMGGGGTAVAVEAADVVILTDQLSRIPEMIELGRTTRAVIYTDMAIWLLSNIIGFALVLTGTAGLVLAAFYNFATDFLPILNSARLFRKM